MMEYSEVIEQLEKKRVTFENDTYDNPTPRDVKRWKTTMHDDASQLSSGRKSIQSRAHKLSKRIQQELDEGVLLLVLSLKPRAELAKIQQRPFLDALKKWWEQVSHPHALKMVASDCFQLPYTERAVDLGVTPSTSIVQSAAAAFEVAIWDAARSIPSSEARKAWVNSAYSHLTLLKQLNYDTTNNGENAKVAIMADLDVMERYVGNRLFNAAQASRMRIGEQTKLTKAFSLYLARDSGEDFVLEIWMCSIHGLSILEEERRMTSVEDWKTVLGECLYLAMATSKSRKIEEDIGNPTTEAVKLCFPNGDNYDSKLEVKINFDTGLTIWNEGFP
ncbi:hypothetical protein PSV09DRAFT_1187338 [Bipolaris maydis]|nr:hypothetical protein PSV09DRAFT_1187338 [Bipolaris maydis]